MHLHYRLKKKIVSRYPRLHANRTNEQTDPKRTENLQLRVDGKDRRQQSFKSKEHGSREKRGTSLKVPPKVSLQHKQAYPLVALSLSLPGGGGLVFRPLAYFRIEHLHFPFPFPTLNHGAAIEPRTSAREKLRNRTRRVPFSPFPLRAPLSHTTKVPSDCPKYAKAAAALLCFFSLRKKVQHPRGTLEILRLP